MILQKRMKYGSFSLVLPSSFELQWEKNPSLALGEIHGEERVKVWCISYEEQATEPVLLKCQSRVLVTLKKWLIYFLLLLSI